MSIRIKSIKGVFWTLSGQLGLGALAFLIDIFITRALNPSDYGLIGMTIFFMTIGQTLMESGLTSSLIRTKDPDHIDYSSVFFINMAASILIYAVVYLAAPYIALFYQVPDLASIVRVYMLGIVMIALGAVQQTRLKKEMNFKTETRIQIVAKAASGIGAVAMVLLGFGVWSLVFFYLINQALLSIQYWIYTAWYPSWAFHFERSKHHFLYGYKLTLSSLLEATLGNIYFLVIGKFFSANILGYYTRANQLKQVPVNAISGALSNVTFPLFASIQDQPEKLRAVYRKIMQQVLFWVAPVLIGAGVIAAPLFELAFTSKWLPAVPYFQILCAVGILYPIHSYNLNILKVFGRSDLYLKLELIKKGLIVANVLISLRWGVFALLVGQLITSNIGFLINSYYSGRFIQYPAKDQVRDILPILGLAGIMGTLVELSDHFLFISLPLLVRLMIGAGLGLVSYFSGAKYFKLAAYADFWELLANLKDMANVKWAALNR